MKEVEPSSRLDNYDIDTLRSLRTIREMFYNAMDDDFNASKAFSYVYELTNIIFKKIETRPSYTTVMKAHDLLREFNEVLGVLDEYFQKATPPLTIDEVIGAVVDVRNRLRKEGRYELADWIRDRLSKVGIKLMDSKEGTTWRTSAY